MSVKSRRRATWRWLVLVVLVTAGATAAPGVIRRLSGSQVTTTEGVPVNYAEVVTADLTQEEEFNGRLESVTAAGVVVPTAQRDLAFGVSGTVAEVLVQVGEPVQAGDVLARLDTADLDRDVAQARIALRLAQIALETAQQPATDAAIQSAQDAVDQAAGALALAQVDREAAFSSTLFTQSLPDAQDNYNARLSDYNGYLERYQAGETTYWYVDQALQALESAEEALTSTQLAVDQTTITTNNDVSLALDRYNQTKATLDLLLAGAQPSATETLQLQMRAAALDLATAEDGLAGAELFAPFDGVVTTVAVQAGQLVAPSEPAVVLVDNSVPTVEIQLSETNLGRVSAGTEVEVRFSALTAEQFSGTVVQIAPQLAPASGGLGVLQALVRLDDARGFTLRPGMTASATLIGGSSRIVRVYLPLVDEGMLAVGDAVTVELPDFTEVPGTVVFVPQAPTVSASGQATFQVLVELTGESASAAAVADLPDQTSVDVIFVSDAVSGVTAVPVTALVALLEGGYAVEKRVGPEQVQLVAVEIGFFGSDNLIAVTSDNLQPGDEVVVP